MGNVAFIVVTALLAVLNTLPLYWQVRQGNSGAICMGVWIIVLNLVNMVNGIIWFDNVKNVAPVWCDITTKLRLGGEVGRIAAVMCIARYLAAVVSPNAMTVNPRERRNRAIFDYTMCFGGPALICATQIVYQPIRYSIVRDLGCEATASLTWPTLVLWLIWPPVLAVTGVLYFMYTTYRLLKHRRNFRKIVSGAHSALSTSRFIRLAALAFSYLLIGVPITMAATVANVHASGGYFEYSWAYLHSVWHRTPVLYFNVSIIAKGFVALQLWANVIIAIPYFLAFGFSGEALSTYFKLAALCGFKRRSGGGDQWGTSRADNVTQISLKPRRRFESTAVAGNDIDHPGPSRSTNGVKVHVETVEGVV